MNARHLTLAGSLNMFLAVSAGAFGAHALKATLNPAMLDIWRTGVLYQMVHALAMLIVAALLPHRPSRHLRRAGCLLLAGIVLFSGSLYVLALTDIRVLGAITPLGGVAFLVAWLLIAWAAYRDA